MSKLIFKLIINLRKDIHKDKRMFSTLYKVFVKLDWFGKPKIYSHDKLRANQIWANQTKGLWLRNVYSHYKGFLPKYKFFLHPLRYDQWDLNDFGCFSFLLFYKYYRNFYNLYNSYLEWWFDYNLENWYDRDIEPVLNQINLYLIKFFTIQSETIFCYLYDINII